MSSAEATLDQSGDAPTQAKRRAGWWRIALLVALVIGLAAAVRFLPVKQYLLAVLSWTQGLGFWGAVVVAAFYIVACVLFLPGSVLTLGAGFLFGLLWGTVTVSVGSVLGATAAFVVGRFLAREWVSKKVSGNEKFAAIDEAVGEQGFKIVLLTRLSPIFPFNFQNYAYGLTSVRLRDYVLASWIGMIPGTIMYVYFGTTIQKLAQAAQGRAMSTAEWVFFGVGLVVAVAVTVFITRLARRALRKATDIPVDESAEGNADGQE
ncbi:MAG: TVP38/TMEM64 family protein [Planctomycetota bacterium]